MLIQVTSRPRSIRHGAHPLLGHADGNKKLPGQIVFWALEP
jgi:hypothetical protein